MPPRGRSRPVGGVTSSAPVYRFAALSELIMTATANRLNTAPVPEEGPSVLPAAVRDVEHLEDLLSEPTAGVIDTLSRLQGDVIILGVGGKMGPSLARMTRRASDAAGVKRRVIGVSRFGSG